SQLILFVATTIYWLQQVIRQAPRLSKEAVMANLLVIESSPRSTSVSSSVAKEYVTEWQRKHPTGKVVRRNVASNPAPFVTEPWIAAAYTPTENRSAEQKQLLSISDTLIDEIEAADTIVLA